MAGTIGAIFSGASRLGTVVGLAMASAIQTSVEVKHGGPTNFAGRAASFWFLLALACLAVVSLLVFHQNRANENDPSVEEDSGGEKVYQEKSDELVISEVLEV